MLERSTRLLSDVLKDRSESNVCSKLPGEKPTLGLLVSGFVQVGRGDARDPFVRGAAEDQYAKSIGTGEPGLTDSLWNPAHQSDLQA